MFCIKHSHVEISIVVFKNENTRDKKKVYTLVFFHREKRYERFEKGNPLQN